MPRSASHPVVALKAGRILFLVAITAVAQSPPEPTFRTGTELVQISVVAQDGNGKPVTDLHREDFHIFDNGMPQDIRLFLLQKPEAAESVTNQPGVFTNRLATGTSGAWSVLLFDNLNVNRANSTFENTARAQIKALAALRAIPPGDEIAVYALWCQLQIVREFTTDRDSILNQLRRFAPAAGACMSPGSSDDGPGYSVLQHQRDPGYAQYAATRYNAPPVSAEHRVGLRAPDPTLTSVSVQADAEAIAGKILAGIGDNEISELAEHLAGISGRKNLLWLTSTFRLSPQNLQKLTDAGVVIYPIDTLGSTIALKASKNERLAQLAYFAKATGGKYYTDRDDLDMAIEEAINDGRTSYILGFYRPDQSQAPLHRISVQVDKPSVNLRYRTSYMVEAPPPKSSNPVGDIVLAMNRPVDATAIAMTASLTSAAPGRLKLALTFAISNLNLEVEHGLWTGQAEFVTRFMTADGKQAGGVLARTLTFHLKPATYAAALQRDFVYHDQLTIPPKSIELNLAMSNLVTGKIGTVRIPLSQVR